MLDNGPTGQSLLGRIASHVDGTGFHYGDITEACWHEYYRHPCGCYRRRVRNGRAVVINE
eukprot:1176602-Prorocentrum_minimum.AAC.2